MDDTYMEACNDDIRYELWLMKLNMGSTAKNRLADCLGTARGVYEANEDTLISTGIVNEGLAENIVKWKKEYEPDRLYEEFSSYNMKLVTRSMTHFPEKLKAIPAAPYGLFYIGQLPKSFDKCVSIVGARRCSEYGRSVAIDVASELSKLGYVIVSGMALGIDNAAHVGALRSDGVSVAVLGCGVDICYPKGNINTYMGLQEKGAIVSELYPRTQPASYNFPTRNRIISALANQVLIIEAREQSGSLITADFAIEQGKDVYALPGRIGDKLSNGCNRLIEQGANVITSIPGLISNIEEVHVNTLYTGYDNKSISFAENEDMIIYNCLDFYPKGISDIIDESNLEMMRALASIMNLCDMGLAKEVFVNSYVKTR